MRKNLRSWLVVIGVLSIVIACVIAYISTKPAEADVSMIFDIQPLFIGKSA